MWQPHPSIRKPPNFGRFDFTSDFPPTLSSTARQSTNTHPVPPKPNTANMGRVRTKTVKKSAKVIIERYYPKLTLDFETNKRICDEIAIIASKRLRNKVSRPPHRQSNTKSLPPDMEKSGMGVLTFEMVRLPATPPT